MVGSQTYLNTCNMRYESASLNRSVGLINCKKRNDTSLKELYRNLFPLVHAVVSKCISTGDTIIPLACFQNFVVLFVTINSVSSVTG